MISLNEIKQSNSEYQSFVLSDKFTIYKTTFKHKFSKEDLIKRVEENKMLYYKNNITKNHSLEFNIECPEFKSIDNFFIQSLQKIDGVDVSKISKFSWVYTQTKLFSEQWMHTHKSLHRFNKSHINTQWVCVFYISIPTDMINSEGDLLFKNENDEFFSLTPNENDVVIFNGDIQHMTIPNQSSNDIRISYVSNFNFKLLDTLKNKQYAEI